MEITALVALFVCFMAAQTTRRDNAERDALLSTPKKGSSGWGILPRPLSSSHHVNAFRFGGVQNDYFCQLVLTFTTNRVYGLEHR